MAPVNGRPFLAYLIQQLRDQGVRRVVLMTGYRGEMIREYFGDGSKVGVDITYSNGPTEWETGRRVWEARSLLHPTFLLLYSDNFVPFSLQKLFAFHAGHTTTVSFIVQPKASANIRLTPDGMVDLYDSTRTAPGLKFVELGYMVVERDRLLSTMDDPDSSFSRTLHQLAEKRQLGGLINLDPYHSISDLNRLSLTEQYFAHKRILLIDRDGTINARPPRAEYVTSWNKFHWIAETVEAMRQLASKGFRFIVLTNQAGIARGMLDAAQVDALNQRMCDELRLRGIDVLGVYVCPHHWDDGCECRKPAPGMFFQVSAEHQVRLDRTIFIGDDPRDSIAAYNANCESVLIGPERHGADGTSAQPTQIAETLIELAPWITARFEEWESMP
jgi:D-glycero-D-manno-heptose 1,7-bisphosphate phosphatase